jgi:hypothetical protein
MHDLEYQYKFVVENIWRALNFQDRDLNSPSYGSFHYSYWRDKTSEFADARFQEIAASAILIAKDYEKYKHYKDIPPKSELIKSFSSGLLNYSTIQYSEGCFDEWYKGERGIAATEFTSIAFGLAYIFAKDQMSEIDRNILCSTLKNSGEWLSGKIDIPKANHQAAIAAALSIISEVTGEKRFKIDADIAFNNLVNRQTDEKWFPEIGGFDLGYCSVLLDYSMLYMHFSKNNKHAEKIAALYEFLDENILPNNTIRNDVGSCLNPYLSRLGLLLHSYTNPLASKRFNDINNSPIGLQGIESILADDLRFCRWSYLPLIANKLSDPNKLPKESSKNTKETQIKTKIFPNAGILIHKIKDLSIYCYALNGGRISIFVEKKLIYQDNDLTYYISTKKYTNKGYQEDNIVKYTEGVIEMDILLSIPDYFYPSMLQRLVLRIASMHKYGSKVIRRIIDNKRLKYKSAINQSSSSKNTSSHVKIKKTINIYNDKIIITIDSDSLGIQVGKIALETNKKVIKINSTSKNEIEIPIP